VNEALDSLGMPCREEVEAGDFVAPYVVWPGSWRFFNSGDKAYGKAPR